MLNKEDLLKLMGVRGERPTPDQESQVRRDRRTDEGALRTRVLARRSCARGPDGT